MKIESLQKENCKTNHATNKLYSNSFKALPPVGLRPPRAPPSKPTPTNSFTWTKSWWDDRFGRSIERSDRAIRYEWRFNNPTKDEERKFVKKAEKSKTNEENAAEKGQADDEHPSKRSKKDHDWKKTFFNSMQNIGKNRAALLQKKNALKCYNLALKNLIFEKQFCDFRYVQTSMHVHCSPFAIKSVTFLWKQCAVQNRTENRKLQSWETLNIIIFAWVLS